MSSVSHKQENRTIYLAIIGSRSRNSFEDFQATYTAYSEFMDRNYKRDTEIIIVSGGANKGGDDFALRIARKHGHQMIMFFPNIPVEMQNQRGINSTKYTPYYYARNRRIAHIADAMIACTPPQNRGGGTMYTMERFQEYHPGAELIKV